MIPYIRDVLKGTTRPHLFTWLVWSLMTSMAFLAQVIGGGGPGAWVTGCVAALATVVFVLSISHGETRRTRLDWLSLGGCGIAAIAWLLTSDPTLSVVLVTAIDATAFAPTLRKSWMKPREETLVTHALSMIKHGLSIIALTRLSIVTGLYPATLLVMNVFLVTLLVTRRRRVPLRVA
jgi:hypothetical protein